MRARETTFSSRRALVVAAAALVAAVVAFGWAKAQAPVYEAQVRLLSGPVNTDYGTLRASGELARTYAELARSSQVLDAVVDGTGLDTRQLARNVQTSANTVTRLVSIRVRDEDPERASSLADGIGAELQQLSMRPTVPDLALVEEIVGDAAIEALGEETRDVIRQVVSTVLDSPLAGRLSVVEPAQVPTTPVAPRVTLTAAMGAIAGGVVAVVAMLVLDQPAAPATAPEPARNGHATPTGAPSRPRRTPASSRSAV